jgi:hypothetical protein
MLMMYQALCFLPQGMNVWNFFYYLYVEANEESFGISYLSNTPIHRL